MITRTIPSGWALAALLLFPFFVFAQTPEEENQSPSELRVEISGVHQAYVGRDLSFDFSGSQIPPDTAVEEVLWNFGDGVRTTGHQVSHSYQQTGSYTVTVTVTTDQGVAESTFQIDIFDHQIILIADSTAPEDQLELARQRAADEGLLLRVVRARGAGPEVVIEEELTKQLLDVREEVVDSSLIAVWTSGGVGANVLSKFAQSIRQAAGDSPISLQMADKGIVILTDTPIPLLAPAAQSVFDQLQPAYVLLTKPRAVDLLTTPQNAEEAKNIIIQSPIEHRLLGPFSARTIHDVGITNFLSFGINFLVNRGIPINNIILVLTLPVIATILSFSRQVIGIKAFGIITPTMTALSFLVLGLQFGLIVFFVVLLSGTLTRVVMRKLHLLYLPRMGLVLTSVSFAILILLGFGASSDQTSIASFSIFPILILTLLAEEFIAVQFKSGAKAALTITAWTLVLAIIGYTIVSWQLFRTVILSYPEVVLLAIPINILLGRWHGLRLTEYFRFRELLRAH